MTRARTLLIVAAAAAALAVPAVLWASGGASTVTFAEGQCYAGAGQAGPWSPVKKGDSVKDGQYVKTEAGAKMEITLPDGSALRLGDNTLFQLESSKPKKDKGSSFSVLLGKAWAKVKTVSGQGNFEVKTKTAVAGVRGTVFSVLAQQDTATTVKVFEGEVAVNNKPSKDKAGTGAADKKEASAKKGVREEIPPPFKEVSKKQWEEMIAKAMQMVKVAANGEISEPLAFDMEVEKKDEWTAWNLERDAQVKTQ